MARVGQAFFTNTTLANIATTIAQALLLVAMGGGILGFSALNAKEPTNWLFGFGVGVGQTQVSVKYAEASRNQLGLLWKNWENVPNSTLKDVNVAWEFLLGYKHFLSDIIGFRYYANVGVQHYKHALFTSNDNKIGVVDYTANADVLLNVYNGETLSFGFLGGFGVGGAYFNSPVLDDFEVQWAQDKPLLGEPRYAGLNKVYRHHISASVSVGARLNIFQKIRNTSKKVCNSTSKGRRTCKVPISFIEHSIELNAKFPILTHYLNAGSDFISLKATNDKGQELYIRGRHYPGFEVSTPYRFTLRYIFAF